jgi:hypothetical protein
VCPQLADQRPILGPEAALQCVELGTVGIRQISNRETPNGAALKTEAVTPQQAGMEHKGPAERNSSGIGISAPSSDEEVWAYALKEYESTNRNAGLYAKLFAEFEGDEGKTKAAYLKAAYLKARAAQLATEANRRRAAVITHEGDAWG